MNIDKCFELYLPFFSGPNEADVPVCQHGVLTDTVPIERLFYMKTLLGHHRAGHKICTPKIYVHEKYKRLDIKYAVDPDYPDAQQEYEAFVGAKSVVLGPKYSCTVEFVEKSAAPVAKVTS